MLRCTWQVALPVWPRQHAGAQAFAFLAPGLTPPPKPHLVPVEGALNQLADLLKHRLLAGGGGKHLAKGEGGCERLGWKDAGTNFRTPFGSGRQSSLDCGGRLHPGAATAKPTRLRGTHLVKPEAVLLRRLAREVAGHHNLHAPAKQVA